VSDEKLTRLVWRVLLVAAFLPLALPWLACEFVQLAVAGIMWVAGLSAERTEWLAEGGPAAWLALPLDYLMTQAGADL
jgi:hypothetical protein